MTISHRQSKMLLPSSDAGGRLVPAVRIFLAAVIILTQLSAVAGNESSKSPSSAARPGYSPSPAASSKPVIPAQAGIQKIKSVPSVKSVVPKSADDGCLGNYQLLTVIERVESNGRTNAVGDGGRAVGCLQIHRRMVDDVNRILRRQAYFYNDRLSRQKSFAMAGVYLNHYGRGLTLEQKARIWNGGPKGHQKKTTIAYANKVKQSLSK